MTNNSTDNEDAMAKMYVIMDDLRLQSQTLQDNVFHILQCLQEANPLEETDILDS